MGLEERFGHFFKAETKSSGRKLFAGEKISISSHSDSGIHAYVRIAPPTKVTFASESVASEKFTVGCACPAAKRGQFCKHVWATLLAVEAICPDFLSQKRMIEKSSSEDEALADNPDHPAKISANERASIYRKEQYQKQKLRAKEMKRGQKKAEAFSQKAAPEELAEALNYFSLNGFPMNEGPSEEVVLEAKKRLSRVFHPDKGGSHEEMVELNRNCEIILRYL
jgi:hypothetical protein